MLFLKRVIKYIIKICYKIVRKIFSYLGYSLNISKLNKDDNINEIINHLHYQFPIQYYQIYSKDSLDNKRFYNVGAGNQRSVSPYWTYIDLPSDSYGHTHMDIPYDLEQLIPLPLDSNKAEVIFNSFLLEHVTWEATKNFVKEAYRSLKQGGIFHSRVHCYEYGVHLLRHNIISRKFFYTREARSALYKFIEENYQFIDFTRAVTITEDKYSIKASNEKEFTVTALDSFLIYNVTSLSKFALDHPTLETNFFLTKHVPDVYANLLKDIDPTFQKKYPHSHNANFISKEMLIEECKKAGFSSVYSIDLYQSNCPVLWESCFHPAHEGFSFGVEAIK